MLIILRKIILCLIFILLMVRVSAAVAVDRKGPQRVWGELSTTYRDRQYSGGGQNTEWENMGTIAGSSYIWRPWFAVTSGQLNLTLNETDNSGQPTTESEFITGDAQLTLFPTSRFPFSTYYIESRNQFDDPVFDSDVETREYGFRQLYRSFDGRHNYRAEYENNQREESELDDFLAERLIFSADNRLANQIFNTDLSVDTIENRGSDEFSDSYLFTVDHSSESAINVRFENLLSASTIERDLLDTSSEIETAQLSSYLSWHPKDTKDLRLTGNMRILENRLKQQSTGPTPSAPVDSEVQVANVGQGLIYQYTDNLHFSESINVNQSEFEGEVTSTLSESLSARYLADLIITERGDYSWNAGTTYSNLHGDIESQSALDNQFSHSLMNNRVLANGYQMRSNLTQSMSYIYLSQDEDDKRLDHSYTITWNNASIQNQSMIRLLVRDLRELNDEDDNFQLVNLQYDGTTRLDRYSQINGNATLQVSRQESDGRDSRQTTANGQVRYRRIQAFQVPGLVFYSELQLSRQDTDDDLFISSDRGTGVLWENTLEYNIGRIEAEIELDFVKVDGGYDQLFKFQLSRSFGDL